LVQFEICVPQVAEQTAIAEVGLGLAAALLETPLSQAQRHVLSATTCSALTTRHRAGWQIRIGLIDFRGSAPAFLAAACESTAAVQNQFLLFPCHHDFRTRC